ncbi:MAG: site-specific integrase [Candidatus Aminicenantes bacterium]|nr:site-specific integrase [Candidatus Aminicenantes bacterium]
MKLYQNKSGKWVVDFTYKNRRVRRILGHSKQYAKDYIIKIQDQILMGEYGLKKSKKEISFRKFAEEFLERYSKLNKESWKRDEVSLKNLNPFFKGKTLSQIGPEAVERYKAKRKAEVIEKQELQIKAKKRDEISLATINREIALLKTIFYKAVEWGRLDSNPLKSVKTFKEPNPKDITLSLDEMRDLIEIANNHLKPILIIALNTGMRRGEILSLKWENIKFEKRYIHIENTKNGRSREVPMNDPVIKSLSAIPQSSEFVFYNPKTGGPIKDVKKSFKTACKNVGIKRLRFHDLRHVAASRMVEAGIDIVTVSRILGHSDIKITAERYCHPTNETMRRAVDSLGEIFKKSKNIVDVGLRPFDHEKKNSELYINN